MKAHGLGAMLLMYDEHVRHVTSTLTSGWNRLKLVTKVAGPALGQLPTRVADVVRRMN